MIYVIAASAIVLALFAGKDKIEETVTEYSDDWNRWDKLFKKYGLTYDVNPYWLKAICLNESNLGRAASVAHGLEFPDDVEESKSSDGKSWGLMQMTIPTARDIDSTATPQKLNNPEYSIRLAAIFLKSLKSQFSPVSPNFIEYVVKSYNQGAGNTRKEIRGQTQGYAGEYWERFKRNLDRVIARDNF